MLKKLAFVFPGQGSQTVGMLKGLAAEFPLVTETFAEASHTLGYDLWQLVQEGPAEKLNQTTHTQPALLTASVAIWRIWQTQHGNKPTLLAGHSLGEYSALVCAQAIAFSDAVKLVAERGRFMQEAVPEGQGALAAIVGLDDQQVRNICEAAAQRKVLTPANYNAIGQIVIAGETSAVERAIEQAKQAGAKLAKLLPVSAPSHCALMQPAADRLANYLQATALQTPNIPVINNVDVSIQTDPNGIKAALVKQLYSPVRWVEIIQAMAKQNIELIIECGPGKVLAGLNKRIVAEIPTISVNDSESLKAALTI
jgi:[acyl-carrier-protein] S-malonyltransferase